MDGRIAEFPYTTHWTRWCLNILPTCMNLWLNSCNMLITNLRTCNASPALGIGTHVLPTPPFLWLLSVFSCPFRLHLSSLMAPNIPLSCWLDFSSWEDYSIFTSSKVHNSAPWIVSHLMTLLPFSILCPKEVSLMLKTPGTDANLSH